MTTPTAASNPMSQRAAVNSPGAEPASGAFSQGGK